MRRFMIPILLVAATTALGQSHQPADTTHAPAPSTAGTTVVTDTDSREIREQFKEMLRRTPPEVGMVLKLDPSLFNNQQYLATYPALSAFVAQHPEVSHNPSFYLESVWIPGEREPSTQGYRMWQNTMDGVFVLIIISIIVGVLTWFIRTLIEQRRWNRLSRVQTEVHGKVLERLTSNDELLRYIDTPAGRRFLESAPIPVDSAGRPVSAPIGRILWSVQVGLVVAAAGLGLNWVSMGVDKDASQPLWALGIVGLCVGVGFVISAIVSYLISRRLKLFEPSATADV